MKFAIGSPQWNDEMYKKHPTPYHGLLTRFVEGTRVLFIKSLANIKSTDSVLEIGCEQGLLLSRLPNCKQLVGVDISKKALADAKKLLGSKAKLVLADAEKKIPLQKSTFDVIICSQTLEHVHHPNKIMDNIYLLAKPDARIIISVPNEIFLLNIKRVFKSIGFFRLLFPGIEETTSEWHLQIFSHNKVLKLVKPKFKILKSKRAFNIYLIYLLKKR